jgi:hypothetical protein
MVTLNLSTSDWVAIIMGVTQLAASVALAAWTIRGTAPATSQMLAVPLGLDQEFMAVPALLLVCVP